MVTTDEKWWHGSRSSTLLFSFIVAAGVIAVGFLVLYMGSRPMVEKLKNYQLAASSSAGSSTKITSSAAAGTPAAALSPVALPSRLLIPSIGVDANIQQVGLTTSGHMGIPSNFTDVAWYKLGPRPGEAGSAALSGHLDNVRDANAVFARLSELKTGDDISVVDQDGQSIKFRVTDSAVYDENNAPLTRIFATGGTVARLALITCDGVWNQNKRDYSKRLVVYAERVLD